MSFQSSVPFPEVYPCEEALRRNDVKAIVVTGKGGKFSGGFDISSFSDVQGDQMMQPKVGYIAIDILTDTVEAATKPSVAAIDGLAIGGVLEVAMTCHARISTSTAQLRLPELQLGVILGFGATPSPCWADEISGNDVAI